jgi:DNA-binding CsgD family transcriptional regulator
MTNPYSDYGNIIYGDRFIGRQVHVNKIRSRVLGPPGGNLAIVGQRRVGKSSLAYQAVMSHREELLRQRTVPIRVSVNTYSDSQQFFLGIVGICFRHFEDYGWANRQIRESVAAVVESQQLPHFDFDPILELFKQTQAHGLRIILILDEFDKSARFFAGDQTFFDRLRELSNSGQATLLTVSRNPIPLIEKRANITSTLAGTFHDLYLGMFSQLEITEFFTRLALTGVLITDKEREQITDRCGGHPYLLDKAAFEIVEASAEHKNSCVGEALRRMDRTLFYEFDGIVEHLKAVNLLDTFMQALFAPSHELDVTAVSELSDYGLLYQTGANMYRAFSPYFREFVRDRLPLRGRDLSGRELEVLFCLANNMQYKEIANHMSVAESTVKAHVTHIYEKLEVSNRNEAVRRARELDILE